MNDKPFVLSVKVLVHDADSRYLVIRRSNSSKNHPGLWDFPGGKTDAGETFDAALVREIGEETGLTVLLEKVLGAAESELPDRKVVYLFMQAQVRAGDVRISPEHDQFAWLTLPEIIALPLCPQFRGFAESLGAGTP